MHHPHPLALVLGVDPEACACQVSTLPLSFLPSLDSRLFFTASVQLQSAQQVCVKYFKYLSLFCF